MLIWSNLVNPVPTDANKTKEWLRMITTIVIIIIIIIIAVTALNHKYQ